MTLKIAIVSEYPESPEVIKGGIEGAVCNLVQSLMKRQDLELHIVAPATSRKPGLEQRDGMTIHWLRIPKLPGFLSYWSLYRKTIHQCLASIQPNMTHFQGIAGWALGYPLPSVLTIHGIGEKDVLYSRSKFRYIRHKVVAWVEEWGRRQSRNTIIINPYVLDEVGYQIKHRRWSIENPINAHVFSINRMPSSPRILFSGHISPRKNIDGLIRAFVHVHKKIPDATLHLAGAVQHSEYKAECMQLLKDQAISDSVRFLGNLKSEALHTELKHANCFVLVSHQETAPMVVAESMAAGVPVVASRLCGLPYMINEGQTGFLVNPNNEHEIADRLIQLLTDHRLNQAMSTCCREQAVERFHPDHVAKKTLDVYKKVLLEESAP